MPCSVVLWSNDDDDAVMLPFPLCTEAIRLCQVEGQRRQATAEETEDYLFKIQFVLRACFELFFF